MNLYLSVSYEKIAWFNIQPLYERTTWSSNRRIHTNWHTYRCCHCLTRLFMIIQSNILEQFHQQRHG